MLPKNIYNCLTALCNCGQHGDVITAHTIAFKSYFLSCIWYIVINRKVTLCYSPLWSCPKNVNKSALPFSISTTLIIVFVNRNCTKCNELCINWGKPPNQYKFSTN